MSTSRQDLLKKQNSSSIFGSDAGSIGNGNTQFQPSNLRLSNTYKGSNIFSSDAPTQPSSSKTPNMRASKSMQDSNIFGIGNFLSIICIYLYLKDLSY